MRVSKIERSTLETKISVELTIDGSRKNEINSGIGFLDHMLDLMGFYAGFDLKIDVVGDLEVDTHHSAEDLGITLGMAFKEALGNKIGIKRFANFTIPMDESLSMVSIDISGRSNLVYYMDFYREMINDMPTEDFREFFKAFVDHADITLHINQLYGVNDHHKIEGVFKAFGMALKEASMIVGEGVSSTKGVI